MRLERLYVSGSGLELPPRMGMLDAAAAGQCDRRTALRTRMRSVCVSTESGPEMAVRAAVRALRQAGARPGDIDLVLHACTYHQGHDLWAPASYVQRMAVGNACPSMEVRQLSNGGLAAVELGAAYLQAHRSRHSVLITTGDRFCEPGFDRWNTDPGTVCGDGGTALVLSRAGGFARIRSLVTVSDPGLEMMGRGDDPFGPAALSARTPISIEAHRMAILNSIGTTEVLARLRHGQRQAFDRALDEAQVLATDVAWFVLPNLGRPKLELQFIEALDLDIDRTTWSWGCTVGHLGAGDQIGGLSQLAGDGALSPGQVCVLLGAGGGFAWSVAVLEILRDPSEPGR